MCQCRWACSRSTVLSLCWTLRLGWTTLTRLGCLRLALTLTSCSGTCGLVGLRCTAAIAAVATTIAATTLTAIAVLLATATAAQLDRLCFGFWIRFEAGNELNRDFALDEAFDVTEQLMLIHADQRYR